LGHQVYAPEEEGQPANEEGAHDDAQGAGGLPLPPHRRDGRLLHLDARPRLGNLANLQMLLEQQGGHLGSTHK